MRFLANIITLSVPLLLLSGCGFQPVYGTQQAHTDAAEVMQLIAVQTPPGRQGEMLRAAIEDRINPEAVSASPRYRLEVDLQTQAQPFIIEPDGTASRYTLRLSAPYRLVRLADNQELTKSVARHQISYNVSEVDDYATIVAQRDAMRRSLTQIAQLITSRLAAVISRSIQQAP